MREKMMKNQMKGKEWIPPIRQKAIKTAFVVFLLVMVSSISNETQSTHEAFAQGLQRNAQTVADFLQLQSALEDSTTTMVYLDADIVIPLGGITINPAKPSLTIDGTSPVDGAVHTITDHNSLALSHLDTISLELNGSLKSITLQNIELYGKNYYGPVCIFDVVSNVTVTYRNIKYYGPQLTYNTNGTAIYEDCYVELGRFGGLSPVQELAEVSNVIFRGDVSVIQVEAQVYEIFYSAIGGGMIQVDQGADVLIKTYSDSGFVLAATPMNFVAHESSSFRFEGPRRFWELYAFRNVTIHPHASVYIEIENLNVNALLRVDGTLQVGADAEMILINRSQSSQSVLNMNGGSAYFKNPKRVVLYSPGYRPLYYSVAGELSIDAQQVRYWNVARPIETAGGFDDIPLYHWAISDGNNLEINARAAIGALGNLTSFSTNYDNAGSTGGALTASTFHMPGARVIAFGRLHLTAEYVYVDDTASRVIGLSEKGADIFVAYEDQSAGVTTLTGKAGDDEKYRIYVTGTIADSTKITVKSSKQFLFAEVFFFASNNVFKFSVESTHIQFETAFLHHETQIVQRANSGWDILVTDNRGAGSTWELAVRLVSPLSYTDETSGMTYTLENALIFIDDTGQTHFLETESEVPIYTHTTTDNVETKAIYWEENKGILARIEPNTAQVDIPYQGTILWLLKSVP